MKTLTPYKRRQLAYLIDEFLAVPTGYDERGMYRCASIETALSTDDACDRAAEFEVKFPGRTPDGNRNKANARIRRLLNEMTMAGLCERYVASYYKDYVGEFGGWSYSYRMDEQIYNDLRKSVKTIDEIIDRTEANWPDERDMQRLRRNRRWPR